MGVRADVKLISGNGPQVEEQDLAGEAASVECTEMASLHRQQRGCSEGPRVPTSRTRYSLVTLQAAALVPACSVPCSIRKNLLLKEPPP